MMFWFVAGSILGEKNLNEFLDRASFLKLGMFFGFFCRGNELNAMGKLFSVNKF
jgi:hypothetical protein